MTTETKKNTDFKDLLKSYVELEDRLKTWEENSPTQQLQT